MTRVEEFGDAKLILGDCREMLEIKPYSVDFIFVDPTYGHNNNDDDLISVRELALGQAKEGEIYASRPISNDDPERAKALIEWLFNEATKSLVKGGLHLLLLFWGRRQGRCLGGMDADDGRCSAFGIQTNYSLG